MSALEQLVAMGFEEERSKKALETYGFDVERAVNFLVVANDETIGSEQQQVYKTHTICIVKTITVLRTASLRLPSRLAMCLKRVEG